MALRNMSDRLKEKTSVVSPLLSWSVGVALLTLQVACWCDDVTRVSSVEPSTLERATPTNIEVRFEEPVLADDGADDVRVLLIEPSGQFIADLRQGEDRSGIITALTVSGEDSLRF